MKEEESTSTSPQEHIIRLRQFTIRQNANLTAYSAKHLFAHPFWLEIIQSNADHSNDEGSQGFTSQSQNVTIRSLCIVIPLLCKSSCWTLTLGNSEDPTHYTEQSVCAKVKEAYSYVRAKQPNDIEEFDRTFS